MGKIPYFRVFPLFGDVWLDKQSFLNLDNHQHAVNISTNYMINQNWKFGANWR